jgi:hypothetical protein
MHDQDTIYTELSAWMFDADGSCVVKLVSTTKHNHFYQAVRSQTGEVRGYFNDWQPGNPEGKTPCGVLR